MGTPAAHSSAYGSATFAPVAASAGTDIPVARPLAARASDRPARNRPAPTTSVPSIGAAARLTSMWAPPVPNGVVMPASKERGT
jgi:hypothetical protein